MKQKVYADQLRIGMYVCELDRPWTEVGFEPPFELQGFTITSREEIAKVRTLCEYVYVDGHESPEPDEHHVNPSQRPFASQIVEDTGALRNVRYIGSYRYQRKKSSAGANEPESRAERGAPIPRDVKKRFSLPQRHQYEPLKDPPSAESCLYESASTALKIHYVEDVEYRGGEHQAHQETIPELVPVYRTPLLLNSQDHEKYTTIYEDQSPFEEELVTARDVIADAQKIYAKVIQDIQAGRSIDNDPIQRTVQSLVKSVIRNPDALAWLVRLKGCDHNTYFHSVAVSILSLTVGRHLGLTEKDLNDIGTGTLLQDVGTILIPQSVLNKNGKLTAKERALVSQHVEATIDMLGGQDFSIDVMDIIRCHHERHNGSGYPQGISGDLISAFSTIAGMADTYEALINPRPYRPAMTSLDALTAMYDLGGNWFPKAMVEQLIECVGLFPMGSFVLLNTGHIGVVVSRNRIQQLKPKVLMILDGRGTKMDTPESVDLATQPVGDDSVPWKIIQVVEPEDYGLNPSEYFI